MNSDAFEERQTIAGVITGSLAPTQWGHAKAQNVDFFDVKADLEAILSLTGHKNPIIFNGLEHIALHPGQVSALSRVNESGEQAALGWLGRLHPTLEKHYGVTNL